MTQLDPYSTRLTTAPQAILTVAFPTGTGPGANPETVGVGRGTTILGEMNPSGRGWMSMQRKLSHAEELVAAAREGRRPEPLRFHAVTEVGARGAAGQGLVDDLLGRADALIGDRPSRMAAPHVVPQGMVKLYHQLGSNGAAQQGYHLLELADPAVSGFASRLRDAAATAVRASTMFARI